MVTVHAHSVKDLKINIEESTDNRVSLKLYESNNFNINVFMEKSEFEKIREVLNNVQL